jgi:hypothetical protein
MMKSNLRWNTDAFDLSYNLPGLVPMCTVIWLQDFQRDGLLLLVAVLVMFNLHFLRRRRHYDTETQRNP